MKKSVFLIGVFVLSVLSVSAQNKAKGKEVKTSTPSYSSAYMLGAAVTRNLSEYQFTKEEIQQLIKGFTDGMQKKLNYKEVINYEKVNNFINEKKNLNVNKNKKDGENYLSNMSKEKGAKKLDGGLVMISSNEGTGDIPLSTDVVRVNYNGYFINGNTFDSSYKRGEPVDVTLNQVIPCWTKALTNMRVGSKARIGCPSDLAYGDNGIDPVIPGGSTLIFDVELLDIVRSTDTVTVSTSTSIAQDVSSSTESNANSGNKKE
ncbi:MAG: FKBP-type peptidyl-prolyl cis-trans isomerase [Elusimicrobia bacterium]|nr:FKBP-type peptidyl-prolyl cis-trans isomerase [Elusimicrobiota bacterium]